jgi:hypothetical protein
LSQMCQPYRFSGGQFATDQGLEPADPADTAGSLRPGL